MTAKTYNTISYNRVGSFFDYWHYDDMEVISRIFAKNTAKEIEEKIKLKQFCELLPEHCVQLLFLD